MFTCPADNRVSLVDVWLELSRCLVGTRMFTCPADNRVSLVDVWLELECLLARLTTVCQSMFCLN